jgi:tetratricopeptide (TPR) repeat protein
MLETTTNAFHRTLVEFDCPQDGRDLFSAACLEEFDNRPRDAYGYMFAQVFEPHVLNEVARLEGANLDGLETLTYGASERLHQLRSWLRRVGGRAVERINLAAALISLSRFTLAARVLADIKSATCTPRDLFEAAMLDFVISNRLSDKAGMHTAFEFMRVAAKSRVLPADRLLDAAALAVVWRQKGEQVSEEIYHWFLTVGRELVEDGGAVSPGARSSWYRAVAMIPAALGDAKETRSFMLKARHAAQEALDARPSAYSAHFVKTYFESTMKEQLYVVRDIDAALETAASLIELDPLWSPSYGEKAEVHLVAKDFEAAAKCWEAAGRCGPPYVGHHYFAAAQAWESAGVPERSLEICIGLAELDPSVESVQRFGRALSNQLGVNGGVFTVPIADQRLAAACRSSSQRS